MKVQKLLMALAIVASTLVASSVQATSYGGYVRNWWVGSNGDITFYFLDATNSNYVTGLCGWGVYLLKADKVNYDQVYASLVVATKNNYKVLMEVTTCSASTNIIDIVKVCTWTGDC